MRIHKLYLAPDLEGQGFNFGKYTEMDLVRELIITLSLELEKVGIRHEVLEKWNKKQAEFDDLPHSGFLYFALPTAPKLKTKNMSSTVYFTPESKIFAYDLDAAMSEWGRCTVYGHAGKKVRSQKGINAKENQVITKLVPFYANGPHIEEYISRFSAFSKDIANAIYFYAKNH